MRRDVRRWDRTLHDPYEPSHGPACATAGTHTDAPEECVGAFFHRPAVGGPVPKSRSRHPPAAAGCRSPRPARHGTGGGYGRQATGVATGFIRRVPAPGLQCQVHGGCLSSGTGYRGPSGCCVVLQGQAAPRNRAQFSGAHNPDVHIDKRTIRDILKQVTHQKGPVVPLSRCSLMLPPRRPDLAHSPPCHCPKNIKIKERTQSGQPYHARGVVK